MQSITEPVHGELTRPAPNGHSLAEQRSAPAPNSADGLIAVIERIAMSGGNLDALDRIVALRERLNAAEAKAAFDRNLSAMQPRLPTIDTTGKITIYSKEDRDKGRDRPGMATPMQSTSYATMADINDAIRPALADHGFALSFRSAQVLDGEHKGKIVVTGILSHSEGHREEITLPPMQYDASGSKNNVQGMGSTLSYGRRYATLMLLNISSRAPMDMDDDGRATAVKQANTISDEQVAELRGLIMEACGSEKIASYTASMLKTYSASRMEDLTPEKFDRACAIVRKKIAANQQQGAAA